MFDHTGLAIGLSNLMGIATGLTIWWWERKRRIMWQEHAAYLEGRRKFWNDESHKWFMRYLDATYDPHEEDGEVTDG